jgi:hypothetical protein
MEEDYVSANYVLMNDINCSDTINWNGGAGFDPIGDNVNPSGIYLIGNGYTIYNLYINRGDDYLGLFGYLLSSSGLQNINLENVNITGEAAVYVGGLAGYLGDTLVENCNVSGTVNGNGYYVGGLIGILDSDAQIINSHFNGGVMGINWVGGLAGQISSGIVTNSYATGNVIGTNIIGGLVGYSEGTIENSYATGTINGNLYVGGLVGGNYGTIDNSYATGNVDGGTLGEDLGGLVGENFGTILNSYATGSVLGFDFVGGLSGDNGDIHGDIRGFIDNCYANGNATGRDEVGGLVGNNNGIINNSYALGFVNGTSNNGGLIGQNTWMILNSYSNSNVNGWNVAGGLVGSNFGFSAIINNSYSNGDIIGNSYLGGIAGAVENGSTIKNSNATGNIYSNTFDNIFGVAGYLEGTIENSYFTGEIFYVNNMTAPIIKTIIPGGGGSEKSILCVSNKTFDWACLAYSECINETQIRLCKNVDNCGNASGRPETERACKNIKIIPLLQLFDIKFELEDAVIKNSGELSSIIRFENFGNLSTLVNLTYRILNSSGTEVYFEKENVTIITEQIVIKNFKNLNLPEGKYTLILTTIYGNNILDEFRQDFEVKSAAKILKIPIWVWIALVLIVACIVGFVIYKLNKHKKEKSFQTI